MPFSRVSKALPCPVCNKPDWCRVFGDGWAECMRVRSERLAKSGGWMHRIGGGPERYVPPPPKWKAPAINATKLMREWRAATPPAALDEFGAALGVSTAALRAVGAAWAVPSLPGRSRCAMATETWWASDCATSAANSPCAAVGREWAKAVASVGPVP